MQLNAEGQPPSRNRVFVTGATGYMGQALIPLLQGQGLEVVALARPESAAKLPPGCTPVRGDALQGWTYANAVRGCGTFVHLVGVAHPGPGKERQFLEIDQRSALEAIRVARQAGVNHFVYVSVAHPAPVMKAYIAARSTCEQALRSSGLNATILRPWYVLGPGHRWPIALLPLYWLARRIPALRDGAARLGLVTRAQMVAALADAVAHPAQGIRVVEVPQIRVAKSAPLAGNSADGDPAGT
jgi:uncharacterized protein YbjT (DUF2867 family)